MTRIENGVSFEENYDLGHLDYDPYSLKLFIIPRNTLIQQVSDPQERNLIAAVHDADLHYARTPYPSNGNGGPNKPHIFIAPAEEAVNPGTFWLPVSLQSPYYLRYLASRKKGIEDVSNRLGEFFSRRMEEAKKEEPWVPGTVRIGDFAYMIINGPWKAEPPIVRVSSGFIEVAPNPSIGVAPSQDIFSA